MYFLTEIDPNADVKGSRDPLGFQPIWTALGRRCVAHLTTVTTSLRGFSVLMLGLELAERALDTSESGGHDVRERERLACFLRFEQLAAYARYVTCEAPDIRGINRVKRRLQESGNVVTIGASEQHQILSEQRTYGLWGLYMSAARGSGLVDADDAVPSVHARDHIDAAYLKPIGRATVAELVRRVREDRRSFEPRGRDRALARALGELLGPTVMDVERQFMSQALVHMYERSDPTHGSQYRLWEAMRERARAKGFEWSARCGRDDVVAFRDHAAADLNLCTALDRLIAIEPLLATCEALFNHLVGRRHIRRRAAEQELAREWGSGALWHLQPAAVSNNSAEITAVGGAATAARLEHTLHALRDARWSDAVEHLLDQNDAVMRSRGGVGWIQRTDTELRARLFLRPAALPRRDELPALWRNSYFLDALRWIGADIFSLGRRGD